MSTRSILAFIQKGKVKLLSHRLYTLGSVLIVLILWQVLVNLMSIPRYILPSPTVIFSSYLRSGSIYIRHLYITVLSAFAGFSIGMIFGVFLAVFVDQLRVLRLTLHPHLMALQAMPRIALAPLIIVWFGFGVESKIVLGAMASFFPIYLNMIHGLATVDQQQMILMRSLSATKAQVFKKVKLPNTLPFLLSGANLGIVLALLSTIVGEFIGANRGMGYLIVLYSNQMDAAGVFALVLILAATGLGFHYCIQMVEDHFLFWAVDHSTTTV